MNNVSRLQKIYKRGVTEELQRLKEVIDEALESNLSDTDIACGVECSIRIKSSNCIRSLIQYRTITCHNL